MSMLTIALLQLGDRGTDTGANLRRGNHCVVQAGSAEEIVLARVNLGALRAYRQQEKAAAAYRKPRLPAM